MLPTVVFLLTSHLNVHVHIDALLAGINSPFFLYATWVTFLTWPICFWDGRGSCSLEHEIVHRCHHGQGEPVVCLQAHFSSQWHLKENFCGTWGSRGQLEKMSHPATSVRQRSSSFVFYQAKPQCLILMLFSNLKAWILSWSHQGGPWLRTWRLLPSFH